MKRYIPLVLLLCLCLCACGVNKATQTEATATAPTEASTAPTQPTEVPTTEATLPQTQPTEVATEPAVHSSLFIPGVSVESVISWFNEVCLDAEFVSGGDPSLVQKWTVPIYYTVNGEATDQDLQVLQDFCRELNAISGFPGIHPTDQLWQENLTVRFCPRSDFGTYLGSGYEGLDGAVQFWYDGNNAIYDATVCYGTDLDQHIRNSVLLEEIYNGLGPVQDTWQREDSIVYAGYTTPQSLTDVDWLLLKLLYHPDMKCGMDAGQCEQVIRALYY